MYNKKCIKSICKFGLFDDLGRLIYALEKDVIETMRHRRRFDKTW